MPAEGNGEPDGPGIEAPQLRQLLEALDENRAAARAVVAGLDGEALRRRPESGVWSVAECLDHLVVAGDAYLPGLDRAVARAREEDLRAPGPFRRRWVGRLVIRALEPPPSFPIPAPPSFRPSRAREEPADRGGDDPLTRFLAHLDRLARRIREADGLDLEAVKVPSPVLPLLRFNLLGALALQAAHQRRHLWQARRVVEALEEGPPAG